MARPAKKGLDYFPFDVGFFEDIKIKRLRLRYGTDGICLYLYLLTQIYAEGYYMKIKNEEDFYDDIKDTLDINEGKARQIIKYCSDRSMIVEIIPGEIGSPQAQNVPVQGVKVLTAAGIQMRYVEAMKGRKKDITEIKGEFWLLDEKEEAELDSYYKSTLNESFSEINSNKSENNPNKSEINSANKIKVNKIKEVSKKESNKKENIQTYDEIFSDLEVGENLKRAILDFIKHLKVNGVVMINSRLETLIIRLDELYGNDELSKCKEIRKSIVNGYKRLPCEGIDL